MLPLTGCNKGYKGALLDGAQDTDYIVYNNGSNAVQYGNYLYFINGYRGYEDTDATNNVLGKVTKGGLYRVELNGTKNGRDFDISQKILRDDSGELYETGLFFKDYSPYVVDQNDDKRYLDENNYQDYFTLDKFGTLTLKVTKTETDEDGNETSEEVDQTFSTEDLKFEVKGVQRLAAKTIGTSGYSKGGIFIYDDYCYYASPNNERNKTGTIQTSLTDFFATKLDGSVTYKIYTTENTSSSSPYAFYKAGKNVFLTVQDGGDIVSVKISDGKRKEVNRIAENINSCLMPVNKTYDSRNHNENDPSQFIYTSRAATKDDQIESGTVLEYMRPDGTDRNVFIASSKNCSYETVSDGILYYRATDEYGVTSLRFTNLAKEETQEAFSGTLVTDVSAYTSFYIYRGGNTFDNDGVMTDSPSDIFVIAKTSNGLYLLDTNQGRIKISNTSGDVIGVYGGMVYFYSSSNLMRCAIAPSSAELSDETIYSGFSISGIAPSICKGILTFIGNYSSDISSYTNIYFVDSEVTQFVGEVSTADLSTEDDEA